MVWNISGWVAIFYSQYLIWGITGAPKMPFSSKYFTSSRRKNRSNLHVWIDLVLVTLLLTIIDWYLFLGCIRVSNKDIKTRLCKWLYCEFITNFLLCSNYGHWTYSAKDFFSKCRSSRLDVFSKKVFLKISQNSQQNTCARVSFFNKVAGLEPATFILKMRLWHWCFLMNFAKFLRTTFFITASYSHVTCAFQSKS